VVAEGVETERQRDWVREQGCDLLQGWLYSKADHPANLTARKNPKISGAEVQLQH
jgi:sensor c-di-GMP phosphodiesterase-like protein